MTPAIRATIRAIDARAWSHWSLGDLSKETGYSCKTTWEVLRNLRALKLVRHEPLARGWRRWTMGPAWRRRSLAQVLEEYEWAERAKVFDELSAGEKIVYKGRGRTAG